MTIDIFDRPYVCPVSSNIFFDETYHQKLIYLVEKKIKDPKGNYELALGTVFQKDSLKNIPHYYNGVVLKIREVPTSGNLFLEIRNP